MDNNHEEKSQRLMPYGQLHKEVDLDYIGSQIAKAVTAKTHHPLKATDFMAIFLSPDVKEPHHDTDAICFCNLQFNYYKFKKHDPSATPLYFYNSQNGNVTKMGNTLGGCNEIADLLNSQYGLALMPIKDLLNGQPPKVVYK